MSEQHGRLAGRPVLVTRSGASMGPAIVDLFTANGAAPAGAGRRLRRRLGLNGSVPTDPLTAIRDIALGFPDAVERETWGHPTFRVRDKIFVGYGVDDDGRAQLTMKAAPGEQESLLAEGEPFFLPRYVGVKGWIGIRVDDDTDWNEIAELVADSYREIAPKKLSAGIGLRPAGPSRSARAVVGVGNVIGELVEGKPPKDQVVSEQQADDPDDDPIDLDPDDPGSSSIRL